MVIWRYPMFVLHWQPKAELFFSPLERKHHLAHHLGCLRLEECMQSKSHWKLLASWDHHILCTSNLFHKHLHSQYSYGCLYLQRLLVIFNKQHHWLVPVNMLQHFHPQHIFNLHRPNKTLGHWALESCKGNNSSRRSVDPAVSLRFGNLINIPIFKKTEQII